MASESDANVLGLTSKSSPPHVGHNQVVVEAPPRLIRSVHLSLATADTAEPAAVPTLTPTMMIHKSVFPDHIVYLEDGKSRRC